MEVRSIDEIRTKLGLGFAVYAYEPRGLCALEIHTPDGIYTFKGRTVEDALRAAFPLAEEAEPVAVVAPPKPEPVGDADALFDDGVSETTEEPERNFFA